MSDKQAVDAVKYWLETIVIGEKFCPFAKPVWDNNSIEYAISPVSDIEQALTRIIDECCTLDRDQSIETSLVIFTDGFNDFEQFLDLIELASQLLELEGYSGIYQLAHFHPDYQFEGVASDAAENYTNRAPLPILHLIREQSIEDALVSVKAPENIPQRNIKHAENLGSNFFKNHLANAINKLK
ncbi:MAG: DUF1415 domain-containing protein [Kangiellaceae bacterium]|jgi:hypothetical protein|nr:DUF1415 domain-containing protein [Kangiellaceae bacterium]